MHQAHNLNKKNGGVNSFLVTVWLSIMVRSLRSREKKNPVQQQVGLPMMALFHESRLIHTEPCLLSRRGKPEWVSTFATHCINVNIVKAWTDEWSLAHSFIFLIDMTGLTPTPCTFSDFYREKRGECSRSLGGWPVKLNR